MASLNDYVVNLRLFESSTDEDSPEDARQRRIRLNATRIYFAILLVVLLIFCVASLVTTETQFVQLIYPSIEQFQALPNDARCSCSQSSLNFGHFFFLEVSFHQICSTDFVSDRWIDAIFSSSNSTSVLPEHSRAFAAAQFQVLGALCSLSLGQVTQALTLIQQKSLFSPDVLLESIFVAQMNQTFNQFLVSITSEFHQQLRMIRQTIVGNQLVSGLQSNFLAVGVRTDNDHIQLDLNAQSYGGVFDCSMNSSCVSDGWSGQIANATWTKVPGVLVGCLPIDAILQSTLECLYEQRCLDALMGLFAIHENFTAMSPQEPSRFSTNASIQSIVDPAMMIERWNSTLSYSEYYAQCAPKSCIYSSQQKNGVWTVLFQLIGILGGTTMVLGIFMPLSIRGLAPSRVAPTDQETTDTPHQLLKMARELNWFSDPQGTDRHRRLQRYTTRLCIVLVIISLAIIGVLTARTETTSLQIFLNPDESQYQSLYEQHSEQLVCPCSSMSISQSVFLSIQPSYHQLCSSDFVSSRWIEYLTINSTSDRPAWDYRSIAPAYFRLLQIFCDESRTLIEISLDTLYQTNFINKLVIPPSLLQLQTEAIVEAWRSPLINQFVYQIEFVSSIMHGNQLLSRLNFNYDAHPTSTNIILQPAVFPNCSCRFSSECSANVSISAGNETGELYQLPQFYYGCFPSAGLLQSTLECYYNRSCLLAIDQFLSPSAGSSFNFTALDATRNDPQESVRSMLHALLVDDWLKNISFSAYYQACAPQSCSFSYTVRATVFSVITTLMGFFGGVTFAVEIVFLILLRLVEKFALAARLTRQNLLAAIRTWFTCAAQERMIQQLHFVFVVAAVSTLYLLKALSPRLITVQIANPSLPVYEELFDLFPETLDCSCSQISMSHSSFLTVNIRAHQVCSSEFVSDAWIASLNQTDSFPSEPFLLLSSLCLWSQKGLQDSLDHLYAADFISTAPIDKVVFDALIQTVIADTQSTASMSFLNLFSLLRQITGNNQIMTLLSSNWQFVTPDWNTTERIVSTQPVTYQSCSCAQSSTCSEPSRGLLIGCYPLEALLQADLTCLYNQSCIDPSNTFSALNQSQPSSFSLTTPVGEIIAELMVEEWLVRISYHDYFTRCAPSSCSYSYITSGDRVQGLTILVSLYGGLMVIGRWLAVIVVRIGRC